MQWKEKADDDMMIYFFVFIYFDARLSLPSDGDQSGTATTDGIKKGLTTGCSGSADDSKNDATRSNACGFFLTTG
jgi:hypothetical protein